MTDSSGPLPPPHGEPPTLEMITDDFLQDGFPHVEKFLSSLHSNFELESNMEAILYGFIGKYLRMIHLLRIHPESMGLDEVMLLSEAHGMAMNEVMSDPRIDRIVEEYTVGSTQFFMMKQFGVEENGD
jgi:hypothetical protein